MLHWHGYTYAGGGGGGGGFRILEGYMVTVLTA